MRKASKKELDKIYLSKNALRITKSGVLSHPRILAWVFGLALLFLASSRSANAQVAARNAADPDEQDVADTIRCLKTADAAKAVQTFKSRMPKPVSDAKIRQGILDSLPESVRSGGIRSGTLVEKVRRLIEPVLSIYRREKVYDLIIVDSPTPLVMSDTGVVLVLTTGTLAEVSSDDELLGLIAHEIGHEYFALYSINCRYLMRTIGEAGNEPALVRHLNEVLVLLELECDAFASITLASAGYDPTAFVDYLDRVARKYPSTSVALHPSESTRRQVASGVLPGKLEAKPTKSISSLLIEVKASLSASIGRRLSSAVIKDRNEAFRKLSQTHNYR